MNSGQSEKSQSIGLFGGTFDPVHNGHLRAAIEAREKLRVDEFRMLPAGTPPHRPNTFASAENRLAMLELALSGTHGFTVDDREVRRDGFSYMVDTLEEISRQQPQASILLMIGQDAANTLDTWHDWRRLFELTHLVIMRRPDSEYRYSSALFAELQPRLVGQVGELKASGAGLVLPLELTQLAISSTDIRHRISQGLSPRFLLPDRVIDYIQAHGLYRETA